MVCSGLPANNIQGQYIGLYRSIRLRNRFSCHFHRDHDSHLVLGMLHLRDILQYHFRDSSNEDSCRRIHLGNLHCMDTLKIELTKFLDFWIFFQRRIFRKTNFGGKHLDLSNIVTYSLNRDYIQSNKEWLFGRTNACIQFFQLHYWNNFFSNASSLKNLQCLNQNLQMIFLSRPKS